MALAWLAGFSLFFLFLLAPKHNHASALSDSLHPARLLPLSQLVSLPWGNLLQQGRPVGDRPRCRPCLGTGGWSCGRSGHPTGRLFVPAVDRAVSHRAHVLCDGARPGAVGLLTLLLGLAGLFAGGFSSASSRRRRWRVPASVSRPRPAPVRSESELDRRAECSRDVPPGSPVPRRLRQPSLSRTRRHDAVLVRDVVGLDVARRPISTSAVITSKGRKSISRTAGSASFRTMSIRISLSLPRCSPCWAW